MNHKNLQLPANCAILNQEEMTYTTGGGIASDIFYALGRMFRSAVIDTSQTRINQLESAHGSYVKGKRQGYGVYTFSDGHTEYIEQSFSISANIGDFFYGIGQLLDVLGL